MQLTVRMFGLEFLHVDLSDPAEQASELDEPTSCTTYPVGFVASAGDQRWSESETPDFE